MTARQNAPSRSVGSTGHMAAASAGAAGSSLLKAISLGVENAREAMTTVRIAGDSRAAFHLAP
ncbi:hypothetical protein SCWH03_45870 [Streptomyces pacificus]|uniref:Uncharacterized protein n=1 Tax=Streptomyces pacificus TaxID=2705029 RepID=A0A6A0B0X5_9ACTN|nr:hypothetical protein SCWH03_45870 [Streptomyces pacificus]